MHGRLGLVVGIAVFLVTAALLTSLGGAGVVASPVSLVVILVVVVTHPSLPFIVTGTVVGGLTALEGGWGLGYVAFGQFSGWTTASMIVGGVLGVGVVLAAGVQARRSFLSDGYSGPREYAST